MRNLQCEFFEGRNTDECKECFNTIKENKEFAIELFGNKIPRTRAECVSKYAEYLTEPYLKVEEDYVPSATEEFVLGMMDVDEDVCFELDGEIWISLNGMKEYVSAIKSFERDLKKEGFESIPYKEIEELELEGIWYRRRKKG